jgi:nucleotide-binding universal stress UspA family protein
MQGEGARSSLSDGVSGAPSATQAAPGDTGAAALPADHDIDRSDADTEEEGQADAAAILVASCGLPEARVRVHRFESGDPARDICALAEQEGARLIVLGLHRPLLGTARLGGPLVAIAQRASCDVGMFHDVGFEGARRVLLALGTAHDKATFRVAELLRAAGSVVEEFSPSNEGESVAELACRARGFDLVIAGAGSTYGLRMSAFDVRDVDVLRLVEASLLVVHDGNQ